MWNKYYLIIEFNCRSPTPYDALCLGVPFINPIVEVSHLVQVPLPISWCLILYLKWDHDNPGDRSKWYTQHEPLSKLGSPYVYNVFKNDTEGFVRAIEAALENPIERFVTSVIQFDQKADRFYCASSVLDRMRLGAVERRLGAILEHDWEAEASSLSSKPNWRRYLAKLPHFLKYIFISIFLGVRQVFGK